MKRLDTWYEGESDEKKPDKTVKSVDDSDTSLLETDSEERERVPEDAFLIIGFNRG